MPTFKYTANLKDGRKGVKATPVKGTVKGMDASIAEAKLRNQYETEFQPDGHDEIYKHELADIKLTEVKDGGKAKA